MKRTPCIEPLPRHVFLARMLVTQAGPTHRPNRLAAVPGDGWVTITGKADALRHCPSVRLCVDASS